MMAWLLRFSMLMALAAILAWWAWWWPGHPLLALAGVAGVVFWPLLLLAAQFAFMRAHCLRSGQRVPGTATLLRAWWAACRWNVLSFNWLVAFRERAEPDGLGADDARGQVGMVLVHGFGCNRGVWNPWLARCRRQGLPCVAVTLTPPLGATLDAMVPDLDAGVRRLAAATGRAPLIVAHSMGGLVVRAWLKSLDASERLQLAAHVVSLGVPHAGTPMARFARQLPAVDMRPASAWLAWLGAPAGDVGWTCWASRCDNVVFPLAAAHLAGHAQITLEDASHLQLVFDERVISACEALRARLQG